MFATYFKPSLIIATLLILMGCSTIPADLNINSKQPLETGTYQFSNPHAWQINSQDYRIARHLIEIVDGDNVAQLINERQSLRVLVENNLKQAWITNKLKTANVSDYKVDIRLIKALTTVTEGAVSYNASTQMIIKVQLTYQDKSFVKLFRSNNQWEAPFSTNVSRIREELNKQLSQLLNQIIKDQELNDKLQKF
ncbi:hypothetical protein E2R68_08850 [Psychromonas sp. RZ22]|uniref:YajG family lipoprotein n=1 Tax=Psychromonas algarum TaxID=2555643 RepID=UPI0010683F10|nr:YajG family lipoprotein [Psychromonas sp. RZ22]TEW54371.1 hypothetical protein E2R68_08850 [Psychromonas sp. RZ22]